MTDLTTSNNNPLKQFQFSDNDKRDPLEKQLEIIDRLINSGEVPTDTIATLERLKETRDSDIITSILPLFQSIIDKLNEQRDQ